VTGSFNRRLRLASMMALCALWASTPLIAAACAVPALHCHKQMQMPCCPPAGGGRNCSMSLCPAQAAERAVPSRGVRIAAPVRAAAIPARPAISGSFAPLRELTAGLHFCASVFRLKDDLRI
jgi:hypothetical protein